jgi:hypothetical protein
VDEALVSENPSDRGPCLGPHRSDVHDHSGSIVAVDHRNCRWRRMALRLRAAERRNLARPRLSEALSRERDDSRSGECAGLARMVRSGRAPVKCGLAATRRV